MELMLAIEKFRKSQPTAVESISHDLAAILKSVAEQKPIYRQRFLVTWREEFVPVSIADVAYFVTDSGISWLVRSDGKRFVVDETMEEIASQLNPDLFFRLNRQVISRPEAIKQIHKHFNGKLKITLQPNLTEEVFISRDTAPEFRAWLNR
jgi:two-component system LytT family response regulator